MSPFATLLPKILKWTEILGLATTVFGGVLKTMQYAGANESLVLGLLTLAATYFLSGFIIIMIKTADDKDGKQLKGFADLLAMILRKLLFIGLAVFCVAFLFSLLHFPGAEEMMLIGMSVLGMGSFGCVVLISGNRERMEFLQAPLLRSVVAIILFAVPQIL